MLMTVNQRVAGSSLTDFCNHRKFILPLIYAKEIIVIALEQKKSYR